MDTASDAPATTLAWTLQFVLYTLPIGMALLPSLWLLFKVFKGEDLTSVDQ